MMIKAPDEMMFDHLRQLWLSIIWKAIAVLSDQISEYLVLLASFAVVIT